MGGAQRYPSIGEQSRHFLEGHPERALPLQQHHPPRLPAHHHPSRCLAIRHGLIAQAGDDFARQPGIQVLAFRAAEAYQGLVERSLVEDVDGFFAAAFQGWLSIMTARRGRLWRMKKVGVYASCIASSCYPSRELPPHVAKRRAADHAGLANRLTGPGRPEGLPARSAIEHCRESASLWALQEHSLWHYAPASDWVAKPKSRTGRDRGRIGSGPWPGYGDISDVGVGASLLANGARRQCRFLGGVRSLSPALGCAPRPEGRGGLSVPREGMVSAGNHRGCRLTLEHPVLPNGPLSLQGEG